MLGSEIAGSKFPACPKNQEEATAKLRRHQFKMTRADSMNWMKDTSGVSLTIGQVVRINRTIMEATLRRDHDDNHQ